MSLAATLAGAALVVLLCLYLSLFGGDDHAD